MAMTLERNNMVELNPDEYKNSINIRKNYSVTEKTDGERNLFIIGKDGEVYLANRLNHIKKIGVTST